MLRVGHAEPHLHFLVPDEATEGRRGAAGARAADDPGRLREAFRRHLAEKALGDIIIASPICGALRIGELVQVVAVQFRRQPLGGVVDHAAVFNEVDLAAVEPDGVQLGLGGRFRHDCDEAEIQQTSEVGLGHGRGPR
ncbi:hypothetical protein D3C72_1425700 [compost metagenome]